MIHTPHLLCDGIRMGSEESGTLRWSQKSAQKHQMPNLMIGGSRMSNQSTLLVWLQKQELQLSTASREFETNAA